MGTAKNTSRQAIYNMHPDAGASGYSNFWGNVVTIPSAVYVSGSHTVTWTARVQFKSAPKQNQYLQVYLAESGTPSASDILICEQAFTTLRAGTYTFHKTGLVFTGTNTGFTNKTLGLRFARTSTASSLANGDFNISMEIEVNGLSLNTVSFANSITTAVSPSGTGTLTASASSAAPGATVTLTPTPATGYYLASYTTSPAVTISNNKFTMPSSAITVTANFAKVTYTISKATSPSGAGTVTTSANSAVMGTSITLSQTPATGYYFNGWTSSPSVTISGNAFTMPASNITITAKYLRRSTASVNKTSVEGGGTLALTISTESTAYTHKYQLSFGTGMATSLTNVAAGVTSVNISVPLNWSAAIPSATSKSGGTLVVYTYSGSTQIGSYTITGLTYTVPASVKPTVSAITTSIVRTIGSKTYANIGNYYVQNHSGVRSQATASGAQSSTISSMTLSMSGYSGSNYSKTVSSGSMDFTSGLLSVAGNTTITITATDSRGRTGSATATISVQAYSNPAGTLSVRRVNLAGNNDDMGIYGKYSLTKQYTALGSNTLTWTLAISGMGSQSGVNTSGDLLPNSRKQFSETQEYTVTLTLQDSLETTVITAKLPSARFIMYVSADGNKLGFMKVPNKTIPSGKSRTVEFSADTQIYIGDQTLEDYIRSL